MSWLRKLLGFDCGDGWQRHDWAVFQWAWDANRVDVWHRKRCLRCGRTVRRNEWMYEDAKRRKERAEAARQMET